jgi:hypothetical protein
LARRLVVRVGEAGRATEISAIGGALGSIAPCLRERVAELRFAKPDGGTATVTLPLTFVD